MMHYKIWSKYFTALFCLMILSSCVSDGPAPVVHYGAGKGAGSGGIHTVTKGENLWRISKRYNLLMPEIIKRNTMAPPYRLEIGQRLVLPPPRNYKVKSGDTVYEIARLFSVSIGDLIRINKLSEPYRIYVGQDLRLPMSYDYARFDAVNNSREESYVHVNFPEKKPSINSNGSSTSKPKKRNVRTIIPKRSSGAFEWPVQGRLLSSFGSKKSGLVNDGINIAAPRGSAVKAAENGVVVYTGDEIKGFGNLVLLKHADGWMSAYAHLDKILIERGETVKRATKIGTVGSTGNVDSPQLHFELRQGARAKNPLSMLNKS